MNALRVARAVARSRPFMTRLSLQRRGYADAVSDKIRLTLALPHQVRVDLSAEALMLDFAVTLVCNASCADTVLPFSRYTSPQMCTWASG